MTSSRSSRREAARQADRRRSASRWLLPAAGLLIAAVAVIAIVANWSGSTAGASAGPSTVPATPPTITGASLPSFKQTTGDAADGLAAPVVQGRDYQGIPVGIAPSGKPTVVIFVAHWCPHCQNEVPVIQAWINAGHAPKDVDLVSVSTAIDPTAPNYPPEAWLEREGWSVPVIVDPTNTAAQAYGLTAYPFFVLLDGKGHVFTRLSGEIATKDLNTVIAAIPRS